VRQGLVLAVGGAVLVAAVLASLALGARPVAVADVWGAFRDFDGSADQIAVRELRLPRTLVGLVVGVALGVAGVVMQGLTRNPVADPGLLGVSAGAALGVVSAVTLFGVATLAGYVWFALGGALLAATTVYAVGIRSRRSPVAALVLAGAAVSATLGSLTGSVLVLDQQTLDQYRFWAVGSLVGRDVTVAAQMAPLVVVGLGLAGASARALDAFALGDDVARALGRNLTLSRLLAGVAVVVLTGTAVAAAGPIAFVGLVIPHLVRPMMGSRHGWVLLASAIYAPSLVLWSDVVGRLLVRPAELPVGIVTAVVGAPFLIWVVRRERRRPVTSSGLPREVAAA
jgi:iron complex transport system permease protein